MAKVLSESLHADRSCLILINFLTRPVILTAYTYTLCNTLRVVLGNTLREVFGFQKDRQTDWCILITSAERSLAIPINICRQRIRYWWLIFPLNLLGYIYI